MSRYERWAIAGLSVLFCVLPAAIHYAGDRPKTPLDRVRQEAEAISVRIDGLDESATGVIVGRASRDYWVLTARHAIDGNPNTDAHRRVVAAGGQEYRFDRDTVCYLDETTGEPLDLALFRFESDRDYDVADIAAHAPDRDGDVVFAYGWPENGDVARPRSPVLTVGQAVPRARAIGQMRFQHDEGYTLFYSNFTERGMSGGAVLDTAGRLVGIHGRADGHQRAASPTELAAVHLGLSSGIPSETLVEAARGSDCAPTLALRSTNAPPPELSASERRKIAARLASVETPNSDRPLDWSNAGNRLYRQGQLQQALPYFERAIELDPEFAAAWYQRGNTLYALERNVEALQSFDRALDRDPEFYEAMREKGALLVELGELEEALETFYRSTSLRSGDRVLWYMLGNLLAIELRRPLDALKAYDRAIELNDRFAPAWLGRGRVLMDLGRLDEAKIALNTGLRLDNRLAAGWSLRAELWEKLGDDRRAEVDRQQAESLRP
ncbi:MAG: tetratricopeptide repeat-containing serine protease family protein [Geitlerinemataceae cyanobacterium]